MFTNAIITLIRVLRRASGIGAALKLQWVVPLLLVIGAVGGGFVLMDDDPPADVKDTDTAVSITSPSPGTTVFRLDEQSPINSVLLLPESGPSVTLSEANPTHTLSGSQSVTIATRENGTQTVIRQYEPDAPTAPSTTFSVSTASPRPDEPIRFDAVDSPPSAAVDVEYEWAFGDGSTATGKVVTHSYPAAGTYDVELRVSSAGTTLETDVKPITVGNTEPIAAGEFDEYVASNTEVRFNGTPSRDLDGQPLSFAWAFGDGAEQTGRVVSHTFEEPGEYPVTLVVTDTEGASDSYQAVVNVYASANNGASTQPTARITAPAEAPLNQPVRFDGSQSTTGNGEQLSYTWELPTDEPVSSPRVSETYTETGSYTVSLTVSDGDSSDTATTQVDIVNNPPTAALSATPFATHPTETVTFDASGSNDPNGQSLSYRLSFDDGSSPAGTARSSHQYDSTGTYEATLSVTDPGGLTDSQTVRIQVENRPPSARAGVDNTTAFIGQSRTFDATGSESPDGQSLSYEWTFGDGTTAVSGPAPTHAYDETGTYTATVTATDTKGVTDTDTIEINVRER
jgi:PKD repeat protein